MLDHDGIAKSNIFNDHDYIDPFICNAWVATAIVGSAIIGGAVTAYTSNKAADAQTKAAGQAAQTALSMYNTTRGDLDPYRDIGGQAKSEMERRLPELTSAIEVDPNQLRESDYYKFAESQGLRAAQNSAAARGLGKSGAAVKGATTFAKNLATDTYKTAFDMANINQTNAYTRLKQLIDTGQTAAAGTGAAGTAAANTAAGAQIGAGNAQAAGINAVGGAVSNAANNVGSYYAYKGLYGSDPGASAAPYVNANTGNGFGGAPVVTYG